MIYWYFPATVFTSNGHRRIIVIKWCHLFFSTIFFLYLQSSKGRLTMQREDLLFFFTKLPDLKIKGYSSKFTMVSKKETMSTNCWLFALKFNFHKSFLFKDYYYCYLLPISWFRIWCIVWSLESLKSTYGQSIKFLSISI